MTEDPPIKPELLSHRKFTVDELCEWFQVPVELLPEPGHVMSRTQFQRIKEQEPINPQQRNQP